MTLGVAAVLGVAACLCLLNGTRRLGDLNLRFLQVVYGRGVARSRWFVRDDGGRYVWPRRLALALACAAGVVFWIGALNLLIG